MILNDKTQLEVEHMFSKEAMHKALRLELKEFMDGHLKKEHYLVLHKCLDGGLDKQFTVNVMVELVSALGRPTLGTRVDEGRVVEIHYLVSIIAGLKSMMERYEFEWRYKVAVEIVEELDTVLFDVIQKKTPLEDDKWTTITSAIIGFDVGTDALKIDGLNRYRFPMIEAPIDWTTSSRGGYHTEEFKKNITLNKGSNKQPQEVLDVINILQNNMYTLQDIDINQEFDYATKTLTKKATSKEKLESVPFNVETRLLTTWETYNAVADKTFYLPWSFDFRGRMYSDGYDITLQGDKFKKGMIKPKFLSDSRRIGLEAKLAILTIQQGNKND